MPRLAILLAVALALAGGGVAAGLYLSGGGESQQALRHVELPPLTPGPQKLVDGRLGLAEVLPTSLEVMVKRAKVVFVGRVAAIGGSEALEVVEPARMEAHRVRFDVERVLRGPRVDAIDVTNLVWDGTLFKAEVGRRYLVFAEPRELGERRIRRLVAFGYRYGVYDLTGSDEARNEENGTVHLDEVAERVAAAR